MDERAARELARIKAAIKAGRHPLTAVEAVCGRRSHVLLSAHPLGGKVFLIWRRPGRAIGSVRDADQWQRDGWAAPGLDEAGFAPLNELAYIAFGPDADSGRDLLGDDLTPLACSCARITLGPVLADEIHAALTDWQTEAQVGPAKPKKVIVHVA